MITQLFRLAYWFTPLEQPPALPGRLAYLAFLLLNLAGLALLLYRIIPRRQFKLLYLCLAFTLVMSALAALNRLWLLVPGARWQAGLPGALTLLLLAGLLLRRECAAVQDHWYALLNWRLPSLQLSTGASLVLLGGNLLGLLGVSHLYNWPLWLPLLLLLVMASPQLIPAVRHRHSFMAMQALMPFYLVGTAEVISRAAWHTNLLSAPLPGLLMSICAASAWAYQVTTVYSLRVTRFLGWMLAGCGASALFVWFGCTLATLTARGVSGSDPYGYIQMALDWVRTGTFLHAFPLASAMRNLGLNPEAALHIGYRLPLFNNDLAATVWPTGHAWLLGLLGRVFGAEAVYWGTPILAVCAVTSTAYFTYILMPFGPRLSRAVAALLSALLLATSFEFLSWTLVHMADISALLFTVLCFIPAWLSRNQTGWRSLVLAGLSGAMLGMAYWVRHTQVVMIVPLALVLLAPGGGKSLKSRITGLLVLGCAALLIAVPDLIYHQRLFGSILAPESKELLHYSLRAVPGTTWLIVRQWAAQREFLLLLLWLGLGALITWKRRRLAGIALGAWLLALWAAQAPYAPLRLRDVLPMLPVLVFFTAVGVVESVRWLQRRRVWAGWLLAMLVAVLFTLRSAKVLYLPQTFGFNNFGTCGPANVPSLKSWMRSCCPMRS
ncbi:MAG: glycosyltransferase family 39 protein [Anaerolineae bacterium]